MMPGRPELRCCCLTMLRPQQPAPPALPAPRSLPLPTTEAQRPCPSPPPLACSWSLARNLAYFGIPGCLHHRLFSLAGRAPAQSAGGRGFESHRRLPGRSLEMPGLPELLCCCFPMMRPQQCAPPALPSRRSRPVPSTAAQRPWPSPRPLARPCSVAPSTAKSATRGCPHPRLFSLAGRAPAQ